MLRVLKRYILLCFLIIGILNFSGCTVMESIEKKLGLKNDYFDYDGDRFRPRFVTQRRQRPTAL